MVVFAAFGAAAKERQGRPRAGRERVERPAKSEAKSASARPRPGGGGVVVSARPPPCSTPCCLACLAACLAEGRRWASTLASAGLWSVQSRRALVAIIARCDLSD